MHCTVSDGESVSFSSQKSWSTLVARAALKGWMLWRTDPDDGAQRYFAGRWGQVCVFGDVDEVERFLDKAG